jgi:hypothetical protein
MQLGLDMRLPVFAKPLFARILARFGKKPILNSLGILPDGNRNLAHQAGQKRRNLAHAKPVARYPGELHHGPERSIVASSK